MKFCSTATTGCLLLLVHVAAAQPSPQDLEFFEKEVRPILAENCFECHGPDKQRSDLRLDHISLVLQGGSRGPAIVPGDPAASHLVEFIEYGNVDIQMPPNSKLPDGKIAVLKEWIKRGAPWPAEPVPSVRQTKEAFDLEARKADHWAWQPVIPVEPPQVRQDAWPATPGDRFVLAKLENAGLAPAGPADKRTLIRRAYFDLVGLPPSPEDVEAFVRDDSADAWPRLIDKLLASPAFGERWARHWMDLTRFAESYGHEQDYTIQHAWQYRDYLIRAFNADVPYDQLLREHVAGDLLDPPRMNAEHQFNESIIGTGWWYMHQATHGPVEPLKDEADRIDNQIDVLTKTFLGMTVSCARCHDHKFDAISTADYYSLTAYLRAARQEFAFLDPAGVRAAAVERLKPLQREGADVFASAMKDLESRGTDLATYAAAVRETIKGPWRSTDTPIRPDIVFEDFEESGYARWRVEGEAFGAGPVSERLEGQAPIEGFLGATFANSGHGGDEAVGTLISRPFIIERGYIRFLIGGGFHQNNTKFALEVDGEEVRRANGRNADPLESRLWDVREFIGRTGVLRLVDQHKGSWGHINLDHVVFTDSAYPIAVARTPEDVAGERDLDADRLQRWLTAILAEDAQRRSHPLNALARALQDQPIVEARIESEDGSAEEPQAAPEPEYVVLEDFEDVNYEEDGWFTSGGAFGEGTVRTGDWHADGADTRLPVPGTAHSGLISNALQGTLRSPSFTITHDNIHLRVAGNGGRVRLVVARYELREFNPLLFDTTLFDVITGGAFTWRTMQRDVRKWIGHQAYFEFSDEGDGYIAIDEILFSDSNVPPRDDTPRVSLHELASFDTLVQDYANAAGQAVAAYNRGEWDYTNGELLRWLIRHNLIDLGEYDAELAEIAFEKALLAHDIPDPMRVLAMTEGTPEETRVFIRGDVKSLGDPVDPHFLTALAECQPGKQCRTRVDLADAMLSENNPLTSRVIVNRIWHHLFGRGIVASVDNFGVLGEKPSHPELLDYLATEFRANGWSIKQMIRTLMLSSAYQMSSAPANQLAEAQDPANLLLHRMNIRRMQGEVVRDSILAVAGTLNEEMYGPSVPTYLSPFMSMSRRPSRSGPPDGDLRRTIYLEIRRNFLQPMMLAFDVPLPDSTFGKRTTSNIPAQALILMNDLLVAEQAKSWAERLLSNGTTTNAGRIEEMYQAALARPPRPDELDRMLRFINTQGAAYGLSDEEAKNDLQVWTDLCHVMFTLKEFIFIA